MVFRRGGSLYDAGMRSQMGDYYNLSVGADEFNALGNPLGFSPAPQCVTGDHSTFVAVIDAGVSAARADQLARLLIEGGFLHRQVRRSPSLPPSESRKLCGLSHAHRVRPLRRSAPYCKLNAPTSRLVESWLPRKGGRATADGC
jgi:hypothetical protein